MSPSSSTTPSSSAVVLWGALVAHLWAAVGCVEAAHRADDASMLDGGQADAPSAALDDGGIAAEDASPMETEPDSSLPEDAGTPHAQEPIPKPVANECVADVSAGDHTFDCDGLRLHVQVDELCTRVACGLIVDLHGGAMGGLQMRDNTRLHELAPPLGYIVVHPSATQASTGGTWDLEVDPARLSVLIDSVRAAFHVDAQRVHLSGFSQGSAMAFLLACQSPEAFASMALIGGKSLPAAVDGVSGSCSEEHPEVPTLFMTGTLDESFPIEDARSVVEEWTARLQLEGGKLVDDQPQFRRRRWEATGAGRTLFDYIEHDYRGQAWLDGHCIPGGADFPGTGHNWWLNAMSCIGGDGQLSWGATALDWFDGHPRD